MAITLDTLLIPGRTAFVMCEVQNGILGAGAPWPALAEASDRIALPANAARIAAAVRAAGASVIHCTAENLPGHFGGNGNARLFGNARKRRGGPAHDPWLDQPLPEVWHDRDILLPRYHGISPMTGSPLDSLLRNQGVTTLIVAGVSISFAILNLTMDAVNRGYQVILPRDAVAGFPEDYAEQVMTHTLAMLATIATAGDIIATLAQSREKERT